MADPDGTVRVLHVDDDPQFADLVETCLRRESERFEVRHVTDVEQAWEYLAEPAVDCIVSDYNMPGTDGIEFLEAVRETYPDLPFILFTGQGSEAVASDAISAGATDYLQKNPGTSQFELLANRIENAVSQHRAAETERRLRELTETTDGVLYIFDADWSETLFVNSAYETVFGRSADRLRDDSTDFLAAVHPDDRPAVLDAMDRVSDGETITMDFRVVHDTRDQTAPDERTPTADGSDDGVARWVSVRTEPVFDDGEVERVIGFARDVTERKRKQRRVARERDRLSAIFEAIPEAVVHVRFEDDRALIQNVNTAFRETFGQDGTDLEGRALEEVVVPEDDRDEARNINRAVQSNGFIEREVQRITDDGPRTFLLRANIVEFPDGTVEGLGTYIDITERKRREQDLHTRSKAIESAIDGMAILDDEGCYEVVNQAHADVYGYDDPAALVGESWRTCYDDDEVERLETSVMPTLYETGYWRGEATGLRADGTTFPQELSLSVTDEGGIICVVRDVSERKSREQELRRYETIIETSGDPVYTLDTDGQLTYVNDALVALTGYDREELLGAHASLVTDEDDLDRAEDLIGRLVSGETSADDGTIEMSVVTADGDCVPCENHIGVLPSEGDFRGTVGVLRDVTERVERERELEAQNERLDRFVSVVSHDLRTPLELANARLELLERDLAADSGTADVAEHVDHLADAHDRMATLIDDLLTLTREGDRIEEPRPVSLSRAAERCWRTIETGESTLVADTDRRIAADPDRFRQLLENLVRNAVEHGGDDVTVTIGDLDDGFYVEDDGPGIPPEERDVVFEMGHSTSDAGTGFGLSIVAEIAEGHGWSVRVAESERGGARFEFTGVEAVDDGAEPTHVADRASDARGEEREAEED